jgi:hypothetical protein
LLALARFALAVADAEAIAHGMKTANAMMVT